jgi:hypothetical protein
VWRGHKWWFAAALALTAFGFAGAASTASATFHLIKVRELSPGTAAQPESDYVELQSFSPFQNQIQFGQLGIYNASGTLVSTFPSAVPAGSPVSNNANNATLLIADSSFGTVFPGVTPDRTDSTLDLSAGGGAVCWPVNSAPIDCVSWGSFSGSLPSSAGTPFEGTGGAGAIANGMAITRSISAGCPTFLEDSDDTNNGDADFSQATPNPRPNSAPITETPCVAAGTLTPTTATAFNLKAAIKKCKKKFPKGPKRKKCIKKAKRRAGL